MSAPRPLPAPAPKSLPETRAFWQATLDGRLLVPWCDACQEHFWYPRAICPGCGSFDVSWTESTGRGVVYSFAITRRGQGAWADAAPYVLAYVDLDEGVRILTNIVGCDPETLAIGDSVTVVFDRTEGDAALFRFAPVPGTS